MKVLFISNDPLIFDEKSGVRVRLAAYAAAIGDLWVVSGARLGARAVDQGPLHLRPVFAPKILRVGALARAARKIIRQQGIEVVSAQDPFEHGLAATKAIRGTQAKLHLQIHTDFLSPFFVGKSWKNWYRLRLADRLLPQAAGIRVVSLRIKQSLLARYGSKVVEPHVIPIALTRAQPVPVPFTRPYPFTLMAVSRLEPEKRVEDLLHALAQVRRQYPGVGLVVVGDGGERSKLERMTRELGLSSAVTYLGYRPDATALLSYATAFIQASAFEGYGASLIEAAQAKVPIITTDVGIVGEVLVPDRGALVCPVGDVVCLARQIALLVEDNLKRAALALEGEHAVAGHLEARGDAPARIAADLALLRQP